MSEFSGKGSGIKKLDTFMNWERQPSAPTSEAQVERAMHEIERKANMERMSDEELQEKQRERRELREQRADRKKKIQKGIAAAALSAVVGAAGLVFTADALDKGIKGDDYLEAMKNNTWVEYGTTTSVDDLSDSQYGEIERKVMDSRAEEFYDAQAGEGAFEDLNSEQKDALVGETYDFYGKEENKPEELAQVSDENQKWASEYIDSRTLPEKFLGMFDKVD